MPVVGMNPITIPTFTMRWKKNVPTTPIAMNSPRLSRAVRALYIDRKMINVSSPSEAMTPTKPNSSPTTEKMKSVCRVGKSELILGATKQTFAHQTARTNCDLRLCHLITLTQRISLRIEERHDAFVL